MVVKSIIRPMGNAQGYKAIPRLPVCLRTQTGGHPCLKAVEQSAVTLGDGTADGGRKREQGNAVNVYRKEIDMKATFSWCGLVLAIVLYVGTAFYAEADAIVYEGFDVPGKYTADALLDATSPASVGFVGSWGASDDPTRYGGYTTPSAGLSFGPLVHSPGSIKWMHGDESAGISKSAIRSLDGTPVLATPSGTPESFLWMSVLASFGSTVNGAHVVLGGPNLSLTIGDTNSVHASGDGADTTVATGPFATDTAHFFILCARSRRHTNPDPEYVKLWIDPADFSSVEALGSPDAETTSEPGWWNEGRTLGGLKFINTRAEDEADAWCVWDEVRIGTTLADVTPLTPLEPSGTILIIR